MLILTRSHMHAVAVYLDVDCPTPLAVLTVHRPPRDRSKIKLLIQAQSATKIWRRELEEPAAGDRQGLVEVLVTSIDNCRCRLGFKATPAVKVQRWEVLSAQERAAFSGLMDLGNLVISRRANESLFLSDPLISRN